MKTMPLWIWTQIAEPTSYNLKRNAKSACFFCTPFSLSLSQFFFVNTSFFYVFNFIEYYFSVFKFVFFFIFPFSFLRFLYLIFALFFPVFFLAFSFPAIFCLSLVNKLHHLWLSSISERLWRLFWNRVTFILPHMITSYYHTFFFTSTLFLAVVYLAFPCIV